MSQLEQYKKEIESIFKSETKQLPTSYCESTIFIENKNYILYGNSRKNNNVDSINLRKDKFNVNNFNLIFLDKNMDLYYTKNLSEGLIALNFTKKDIEEDDYKKTKVYETIKKIKERYIRVFLHSEKTPLFNINCFISKEQKVFPCKSYFHVKKYIEKHSSQTKDTKLKRISFKYNEKERFNPHLKSLGQGTTFSDLIDEIINYEFNNAKNNIPNFISSYKPSTIPANVFHNINECIVDKINDEQLCLRMFLYSEELDLKNEEVFRLFIDNNEMYLLRKSPKGFILISMDQISTNESYHLFSIFGLDKKREIFQNTFIKYLFNVLIDKSFGNSVMKIIVLKKYPFIEKLYNSGNVDMAKSIYSFFTNNLQVNPYNNENNNLALPTEIKKKSLYKEMGLNTYQLKLFNELSKKIGKYHFFLYRFFIFSKEFFQDVDISHIDNKTFDIFFHFMSFLIKYENIKVPGYGGTTKSLKDIMASNILTIANNISKTFGIKYAVNYLPNLEDVFIECKKKICVNKKDNFFSCDFESYDLLRDCKDSLRMFSIVDKYLNENDDVSEDYRKQFKKIFCLPKNNYVDNINALHNTLIKLHSELRHSCDEVAYAKITKTLEPFTYENEKYSIVYPEKAVHLICEGASLHHCVGSYIDRVIKRQTKIFFLRKKENINESFFTIELTNKNNILQVNGFGNINVKNGSELHNFLNDWAKEKELKSSYSLE